MTYLLQFLMSVFFPSCYVLYIYDTHINLFILEFTVDGVINGQFNFKFLLFLIFFQTPSKIQIALKIHNVSFFIF